jgi:hypothetical protein
MRYDATIVYIANYSNSNRYLPPLPPLKGQASKTQNEEKVTVSRLLLQGKTAIHGTPRRPEEGSVPQPTAKTNYIGIPSVKTSTAKLEISHL